MQNVFAFSLLSNDGIVDMRLLLATANPHKVSEIKGLLAGVAGLELFSLADFADIELPEETGATMKENARLKATHCAIRSGLACLADDSGIEVDALGGEPGVRSARWAPGTDADRTFGLLRRLREIGTQARTARYRCALCLFFPNGGMREAEDCCEGAIGNRPMGENGFGYDPIFVITAATLAPDTLPDEHRYLGLSLAQAPADFKARVSHRARAIARILPFLSSD